MSEERLKEIKEELAKISFSNIGHCVNTNLILDYITNLQEEIERLNNIINELEKWLKYKKEQMEEFELYKRKETGAFWYSTMGNIETFIERIQELKGEDKE